MKRIVIVALCALAPMAVADEPAATQLVGLLSRLQSLDAAFEQVVLDARGVVIERTRGHVLAQRPGRFRWVSDAPFAQVLVSDGKTLWFYDPDLEQVTVRAVSDELLSTPALLLSGDVKRVVNAFAVSVADEENDYVEFELTPKAEKSLFDSLRFAFEADVPRVLEILDGLGQRTHIRFTQFTPNPTLAASSFEFRMPEGVDVIRE